MKHPNVKGDHSECGPDCCITGDLCCGGIGVCPDCSRMKIWNGYEWRDCIVIRQSSYQGRGQSIFWDYMFDPLPKADKETRILPSMGGSAPEYSFKARS